MAERLDRRLMALKLARSRTEAQEFIRAERVRVDGRCVDKPGRVVEGDVLVELISEPVIGHVTTRGRYVSRGGHKLAAALEEFGIDPRGKIALDVGASTGGFTDCLLQAGAGRIVAVDVGHGQISSSLATDSRVEVREGVNARAMKPTDFDCPFDLIVVDLSFISLSLVLPALAALLSPEGVLICLIKPQFEVGHGRVGKGGIVKDPAARAIAVQRVEKSANEAGLSREGLIESPIHGGDGNIEYLAWFQRKESEVVPK